MLPFLFWLALSVASPASAALKDLAFCDPLDKDSHCPPDPAFACSTLFDFTTAGWNSNFEAFWSIDDDTARDNKRIDFNTDGKGASFEMREAGQAPTLTSHKYIFFGKVTVEVQAAQGAGLVTAIVLKSDSGDEIDWEMLGAYQNQAATNYFYDGQALFNTYNDTYRLDTSSYDAFHKYSVEWTDKVLVFSIDDTARKTWHVGDIPAEKWPQTPMQVKVGVWSVNKDSDHGEIEWAGGVPDWSKSPFRAYYKSVHIEDYMGGCSSAEGEVKYEYNERTHGWQQVQVVGCKEHVPPGSSINSAQPTRTGGGSSSGTSTGDSPTKTGEDAPGETDEDAKAAIANTLSSTLAVIVCLGWIVVL